MKDLTKEDVVAVLKNEVRPLLIGLRNDAKVVKRMSDIRKKLLQKVMQSKHDRNSKQSVKENN